MNLPPFSQTFYNSYHSPQSQHSAPGSAPAGLHPLPPHGMGYPSHIQTGQHGYYPMASPGGVPGSLPGSARQPPSHSYSESPRMPAGYSSSPGMRNISPISPTNHLAPPGQVTSGGSTSSSGYPSATRSSANLPKNKRRSDSGNVSVGSWDDDGDRSGANLDDEDQPWGMPQEQYKALNPRDKKQVRNR